MDSANPGGNWMLQFPQGDSKHEVDITLSAGTPSRACPKSLASPAWLTESVPFRFNSAQQFLGFQDFRALGLYIAC